MAEEPASTGDKTEAATARHLQQAREAGRVPISREATVFASLTAVVLVLAYQSQSGLRDLLPILRLFLAQGDGTGAAVGSIVPGVLATVTPVLAAAAMGAAAAVLLQTGFLLSGSMLRPKASRINPFAGFKRSSAGTALRNWSGRWSSWACSAPRSGLRSRMTCRD